MRFCPKRLGGDLGQGQENLVGVGLLQGGGRPSKGGERRRWPGAEQTEGCGKGKRFQEVANEAWANLS